MMAHAYKGMLSPLCREEPTEVTLMEVRRIRNLTLGDFKVALQKATLQGDLAHEKLIKMLEEESEHRAAFDRKPIGIRG